MTGMRSVAVGFRARSSSSWDLPSWVMAMVLPVPAAPETIRPRRALIAWRFSSTRRRPQVTVWGTTDVRTTSNLA